MNSSNFNSTRDVSSILAAGIALHQSGQPTKARECYKQVLEADPENSQVMHLMGLLAHQEGQSGEAAELLRFAIRHDSMNPHFHNDLGTFLEDLGYMDEALDCYRRALNIKPDYFEAANNAGNVFYKLNCKDEALACYQKALDMQPDYAEGYVNIGNIAHDRGQFADAVHWYQKALKLNPGLAAGLHHLGLVYKDQGRCREAIACYQKALPLTPAPAGVLNSLGIALRSQGRLEEAVSFYHKAIEQQPAFAEGHTNLGIALKDLGNLDGAIECFQQALLLKPDMAETYNCIGNVLREKGNSKQAISCYLKAIQLKPDLVEAHYNLGSANKDLGNPATAIQSYQAALVIKPDYAKALSQLYFQSLKACFWKQLEDLTCRLDRLTQREYAQGQKTSETPFVNVTRQADPAVNFEVAKSWSRDISKVAVKLKKEYKFNRAGSNQSRIRIGYISNDFRNHPISHLILSLFKCHDRRKFEIFCYSHGKDDGSFYRKRIEKDCDRFIDISGLSDEDAADLVYEDRVDIFVDLMGYTHGHRLTISALRPAPVQVNFLGFPGTTGAGFFDYIIADRTVIPQRHKPFYSEKIVSMPHCYQVNDHTQAIASQRSSAAAQGLPEGGFVFCAFHQSFKIDPLMFNSWMTVLSKVPGSVLWLLKNNGFAEQNLKMAAEEKGIDPQRLVFAPRLPKDQHLGRHRLADLMLDTRTYNGHTTTSDALWAGVPVITLRGSHFASRVSASILMALGLSELITTTLEAYEKLAVWLALNSAELKMLRRKIAKNQSTQPLFDTRRYVRNLEKAFIQMWQIHSTGQRPAPIEVSEK